MYLQPDQALYREQRGDPVPFRRARSWLLAVKPGAARDFTQFWKAIGYVMACVATVQGAGYLVGGSRVAQTPTWYVVEHIYGGIRLHGAVMLVLGCTFVVALRSNKVQLIKPVLKLLCGYSVAISVSIFGSWWITHKIVFGSPWWWIAIAAVAAAMTWRPPPPYAKGTRRA